jgi:hypothetical protein
MSADVRAHRARRWRVHTLAPDFELLDLWEVPLDADPSHGETFAEFLRVFLASGADLWPVYRLRPTSFADAVHAARLGGALALLRFRRVLGLLLRLDADRALAIPGCREERVRARLDDADRAADTGLLPSRVGSAFEPVYAFAEEALLEIANRTIHALLHLSWVAAPNGHRTVVLAIYVKSRGWQSRAYLALIRPFRHMVVYPAWIAHLTRTWEVLRPSARGA